MDENRNVNVQSIFASQDPEFIAETLLEELNKAIKSLVVIKKNQAKKHQSVYWNRKLESHRKQISYLTKVAQNSKSHEDKRVLKNAKNKHSREIRKTEKEYFTKKYSTNLGKWAQLKENTEEKNKTLIMVVIEGKETTSPTTLANKYSEAITKKINELKDDLPKSTLTA